MFGIEEDWSYIDEEKYWKPKPTQIKEWTAPLG
jgi:hypothetical protein